MHDSSFIHDYRLPRDPSWTLCCLEKHTLVPWFGWDGLCKQGIVGTVSGHDQTQIKLHIT